MIVVTGTVVHGSGDGTKLGFPTANLSITSPIDLTYGVYACIATIDDQTYKGVLHYGPRSIFGEINPQFEVHLFDFNKNIYGKIVTIQIHDFIRGTIKFTSIKELTIQIQKDCEQAKKLIFLFQKMSNDTNTN